MKPFTIKLLSFLGFFVILLYIGILISYKTLNNSLYFKISNNTNFIVLGHSHSECAFNDSLILHSANFSQSGESYFYTYLKTRKIITSNKHVKAVFIEFSNNQIEKSMDSWTWGDTSIHARFLVYLPIMASSDFSLLWKKNPMGVITCPLKSYAKNITINILNSFKNKNIESDPRFGKYRYLVRDKTDSLISNPIKKELHFGISETNILYLSKIIEFCKANHVKVYLVRSPLHPKYPGNGNEQQFKKVLSSRFSETEFLDFKGFPLKDHEFGDLQHLNYKGAKIFSIFFNRLLNMNLLNKNNKQDFINSEISKFSNSEPLKNQEKLDRF